MVILAQLQRLFSPRTDKYRVQHLYIALVEQARNPVFYTNLRIPDTLDGRFEVIVLHMHLVLQRLQAGFERSPALREISRELIEYYFADMDRSLREMGVGDTGVHHKVHKMSSAFYGRLEAYGMADEDPTLWPEALRRNIYGTTEAPDTALLATLIAYIAESRAKLAAIEDENLAGDTLVFAELQEDDA